MIEFIINNEKISIQVELNDRFEKALKELKNKINVEIDNLRFLANDKVVQETNTIKQIMNEKENQNYKITIKVIDLSKIDLNKNNITNKNVIICPECKEQCEYEMITYKIKLNDCINGHKIKKINLNKYLNAPNVDISCDICKNEIKSKFSYNRLFSCYECNMNMCLSCKLKHDNTHTFISYDYSNIYNNKLKIAQIDSIQISNDKEKQQNNLLSSQKISSLKKIMINLRKYL